MGHTFAPSQMSFAGMQDHGPPYGMPVIAAHELAYRCGKAVLADPGCLRLNGVEPGLDLWSRLGSNQRPSACEADALPLSHGTGAERRTTSKTSTAGLCAGARHLIPGCRSSAWTRKPPRDLCAPADVDYRRASHRTMISPEARGCSAVGSASPCQGEGRGFESRHPLEGASGINPQRWSGRVVRQRPAKPCTRVRFPSPPPILFPSAISSAGERFPDTEEVTGSIPVSRTNILAFQTVYLDRLDSFHAINMQ